MELSIGARTYATKLDPYAAETGGLLEAAEEALSRPSDASFWDEELYASHTLMFATPDWSLTTEYTVGQANYRAILEDMTAAYRRSPGAVSDASVGHWTYSRFQCIKIRVAYADGTIHPAFADAYAIATALERDYPLYSDDTHSELEWELWESTVDSALADAQSDDDSRESEEWAAAFREAVGEWYGYDGVDYVSDEHLSAAIAHADAVVTEAAAAAEAVGLPYAFTAREPLAGI